MRLLLKLIAVIVVAVAVVSPRGTAHDRVMLVVVEGARGEVVREFARAGHLPTLEKVIAGGVGGDITNAVEASSTEQVLARIVSVPAAADAGRSDAQRPLWALLARQARPFLLSGVPGVEAGDDGRAITLPGPNAAGGFIGANTGLVVNRRTIERDAVPWPYGVVSADLKEASAAASAAGSVHWLRWHDPAGADARVGAFGVYALDGDAVYLTPVYTRVIDDTAIAGVPAGQLYVGDDPTRVLLSSRAAEYLPRHAADLADARAAVAMAIAASRPWELLVHVDRRIAITETALAPPATGAARDRRGGADDRDRPVALVDAYEAVDSMIADWIDAAGERTAVLVVGLTPQPRARGEAIGWFAVASVVGDLGSWGPVTADDLSATLSYLLSFNTRAGHEPLGAIAARFPLRSRFSVRAFLDDRAGVSVRADGRSLQDFLTKLSDQRR